jgi:hypothetical protein
MSNPYGDSISTRGILGNNLGTLGRVEIEQILTGENYVTIICQSSVTSAANNAAQGNSSETSQVICAATATNAADGIAEISCNSSVTANGIKTFIAAAQITCQSTITATGDTTSPINVDITCQSAVNAIPTKNVSASTDIVGETTLTAEGVVLVNQAFIVCNTEVVASGTVKAGQKRTGRVDWENTLGAGPAPVFGWAGGVGSLPPAIAVTFIYGKHIYSDVKRRKREISVDFESLTHEVNEIKIDLVKLSKKSKKPRFKMKANNGKIHPVEK